MERINLQTYPMLSFTTAQKTGFNMSFEHMRFPTTLFFLLLYLHLHLLPAIPMVAAGRYLDHGKQNMEAKLFSISTESGGKHEIEVVEKHGGGAHGGGGGDAAANGGGGDNGRGSGAQIPVYTAGGLNHNRGHHHHGSNGGTINRVGSSCLALILFASIYQLVV